MLPLSRIRWRQIIRSIYGSQFLHTLSEKIEIGSKTITIETSVEKRDDVYVSIDETRVLSSVTIKEKTEGQSQPAVFDISKVNYEKTRSSAVQIPRVFAQEGDDPKEHARIIYRPIRPLFPFEFLNEIEINACVVLADGKQDPDVLAINATSAALVLSGIPWQGPLGVVRIGRVHGQLIINPSTDELSISDLNLMYGCTKDQTLIVEGYANGIIESDFKQALRLANLEALKLLELQLKFASLVSKHKKGYVHSMASIKSLAEVSTRDKVLHKSIFSEGREDGRCFNEVRLPHMEATCIPKELGSSLFTRANLELICDVSFKNPRHFSPSAKRVWVKYTVPSDYDQEEIRNVTLAEKAFVAILPRVEHFPYPVTIKSEVKGYDGSISMAIVCAGSIALMDAIPLSGHVAGLSLGLVTETDPSTGQITNYRILTDIAALEYDQIDMEFKIAGNRKGITAILLDIKRAGIPLNIVMESLDHARKGRLQILEHMEKAINVNWTEECRKFPRRVKLKYNDVAIDRIHGELSALERNIDRKDGTLSVDNGFVTIDVANQSTLDKVLKEIGSIVGDEIKKGGVYKGEVISINLYGAFVEFTGGQQGFLHISELSNTPVSEVGDVVEVGQQLDVTCIGVDVGGGIHLSLCTTRPTAEGAYSVPMKRKQISKRARDKLKSEKPRLEKWTPPPRGKLQLQTDASYNHETREAFGGGLVRDDLGSMHACFTSKYGYVVEGSTMAEAMALRDGLKLCESMGLKDVEVQTDNSSIAQLSRKSEFSKEYPFGVKTAYEKIIEECQSIITSNGYEISSISRNLNFAADYLSYLAQQIEQDFKIFYLEEDMPLEFQNILDRERLGIPYYIGL